MTSDNFPPSSRYHDIDVATLEVAAPDVGGGRTIAYLRRRFVPAPERHALLREHVVRDGERLDQIAALYLGDPEQFWRIADANGAIAPEALTDVAGRTLRITLPADVPGMTMDDG